MPVNPRYPPGTPASVANRRHPAPRTGKDDAITQVADALRSEVERTAPVLAAALFGRTPPGRKRLSRPAYLALVREHWADPPFRQLLHQQLGDRLFVQTFQEAQRDAARLGAGGPLPVAVPEPGAPPSPQAMGAGQPQEGADGGG